MALARLGNYGFVFIDDAAAATGGNSTRQPSSVNSAASGSLAVGDPDSSPKVNIAFANEDYSRAVNTVLLASGLGARLEGRLIMAGKNIHSKSFGPRLSKVYRLNQVSPGSAADYLANLGASVTKTNTVSTAVSTGSSQSNAVQGAPSSSTTTSTTITSVESYGASMGPLLGLQATTDSRLRTITLIGDPALVAVAEQYLRQLDLRQRQVALSVKILDVTLNNDSQLANSFAFRSGSSFILSDNGSLRAVFGSMTPGGQANPGLAYPNNELLDEIRAVVTSSSTKVLASPTLILSENAESTGGGGRGVNSSGSSGGGSSGSTGGASSGGAGGSGGGGSIGRSNANEGFVTVGETVITGYSAVTNQTSTVCTPQKTDAGLSFGAKINKIDDNGFVTFSMSPEISAQLPGGSVPGCGPFFNIAKRRLDTGTLRVRDGQTLVLTGVINEDIQANVSKWPILGDLPIIGQFFRATGANRGKSELVILVTPRILREDDSADPYGYGYRPSSQEARQFMGGY
jgi:type IV pilus assembly protein PilQ